jgi:hypothetical protein
MGKDSKLKSFTNFWMVMRSPEKTNKKTFSCGEGGAVHFVSPDLAKTWRNKRRE